MTNVSSGESLHQHTWVGRLFHYGLLVIGIVSLVYFFNWWFSGSRLSNPLLFILFIFALAFSAIQLLGNWTLYAAAMSQFGVKRYAPPPIYPTIDVFLTAFQEDVALVERALAAAITMRVPHKTWLLDDGPNPILEKLAAKYGAGYLTRSDRINAKAGNVNAALGRTHGEIVVIFDIDHAPHADFLERVVGHFADPKIGFVQVMLTFDNHREGWVASAAADTSLDFYNPVSVGADVLGSTTLVGSNALIRREALNSIGGYQPGLAEDLATSIALHSKGWKSVYVHEPLAPGYAPPDLRAWFTQQAKWSRGVFEIFIADYPKRLRHLTWGQRLTYAVRMTYYWIGSVAMLHLLATVLVLFSGHAGAIQALDGYLLHLLPLGIATVLIRQASMNRQRHPSVAPRQPLKPLALVYLTWPVYSIGWIMAILRLPLRFRPTPKSVSSRITVKWLVPPTVMSVALAIGLIYSFSLIIELKAWLVLTVAVLEVIGQLLLYVFWYKSKGPDHPQTVLEFLGEVKDLFKSQLQLSHKKSSPNTSQDFGIR